MYFRYKKKTSTEIKSRAVKLFSANVNRRIPKATCDQNATYNHLPTNLHLTFHSVHGVSHHLSSTSSFLFWSSVQCKTFVCLNSKNWVHFSSQVFSSLPLSVLYSSIYSFVNSNFQVLSNDTQPNLLQPFLFWNRNLVWQQLHLQHPIISKNRTRSLLRLSTFAPI